MNAFLTIFFILPIALCGLSLLAVLLKALVELWQYQRERREDGYER